MTDFCFVDGQETVRDAISEAKPDFSKTFCKDTIYICNRKEFAGFYSLKCKIVPKVVAWDVKTFASDAGSEEAKALLR